MKKILLALTLILTTNFIKAQDEAICHGTYIISGVPYYVELQQYDTNDIGERSVEVVFYKDYITVDGIWCDLIETYKNGNKEYSDGIGRYIVTPSFNMRYETYYIYTAVYQMRLAGELKFGSVTNR